MKRYARLVWGRPCTKSADVFFSLRVRREQRRTLRMLKEQGF